MFSSLKVCIVSNFHSQKILHSFEKQSLWMLLDLAGVKKQKHSGQKNKPGTFYESI